MTIDSPNASIGDSRASHMPQRQLREHLALLLNLAAGFLRHVNAVEKRVESLRASLPSDTQLLHSADYFDLSGTGCEFQEVWEAAVAGITRAGERIEFAQETHWVCPHSRRSLPLRDDLMELLGRRIILHKSLNLDLDEVPAVADPSATETANLMKVRELSLITALETQLIELGGTPPQVWKGEDVTIPADLKDDHGTECEPAPF